MFPPQRKYLRKAEDVRKEEVQAARVEAREKARSLKAMTILQHEAIARQKKEEELKASERKKGINPPAGSMPVPLTGVGRGKPAVTSRKAFLESGRIRKQGLKDASRILASQKRCEEKKLR